MFWVEQRRDRASVRFLLPSLPLLGRYPFPSCKDRNFTLEIEEKNKLCEERKEHLTVFPLMPVPQGQAMRESLPNEVKYKPERNVDV